MQIKYKAYKMIRFHSPDPDPENCEKWLVRGIKGGRMGHRNGHKTARRVGHKGLLNSLIIMVIVTSCLSSAPPNHRPLTPHFATIVAHQRAQKGKSLRLQEKQMGAKEAPHKSGSVIKALIMAAVMIWKENL